MLLISIILIFCITLIFHPIGKLKLGKPDDKPEFNTISWLTMLFSAGMGIGLVFYGSSEPISHYLSPPTSKETEVALKPCVQVSYIMDYILGQFTVLLHWLLHIHSLEK